MADSDIFTSSLQPSAFLGQLNALTALLNTTLRQDSEGDAKIQRSFAILEGIADIQSTNLPESTLSIKLHMTMASALADITLEFESQINEDTLVLAVFGMPQGGDSTFALARMSATRWGFKGIIELPEEVPSLTFTIVSGLGGDIGYAFLDGTELTRAKSWALDSPRIVRRTVVEDCDSSVSGQVILSFTVWPLVHDAKVEYQARDQGASDIAREKFLYSQQTDDPVDLKAAIASLKEALSTVPNNCETGVATLLRLSQSLLRQSQLLGNADGVDESIATAEKALQLVTDGDISGSDQILPTAAYCVGASLRQRYDNTGDKEDFDRAIKALRQAAHTVPTSHGSEAVAQMWCNLGVMLMRRYNMELSGTQDIDEAIASLRKALHHALPEFAQQVGIKHELGEALCARWIRKRVREDADEGLRHLKECLRIERTPRPRTLHSVGTAYYIQFREYGDLDSLHKAISAHQTGIQASGGAISGNDGDGLAKCLIIHFQYTRDFRSLSEVLKVYEQMRAANPDSITPATIDNIAFATYLLAKGTTDVKGSSFRSGILKVIQMQESVIALTPADQVTLPIYLRKVGVYYTELFTLSGELEHIERGIDAFRKSAEYIASSIPAAQGILFSDLGEALAHRYGATRDISDIEEAVLTLRRAGNLLHEHQDPTSRAVNQCRFGDVLQTRHSVLGDAADVEEAIGLYSSAASLDLAAMGNRLRGAVDWAKCTLDFYGHTQALEPFEVVVNLVTELAGLEETMQRRHELLSRRSIAVLTASVAAIFADRVDKAVEWLEQGRGLVWGQLNSLRTPLDLLQSHSPGLSGRLESVCRQLEVAGSETRLVGSGSLDADTTVHDQASKHLQLARERADILREIRADVPGFTHFLRPRPCNAWLETLPPSGPVVIINVHEQRCDAIALVAGLDEPLLIPLPDFSFSQAEALGKLMKTTLVEKGVRIRGSEIPTTSEDRKMRPWGFIPKDAHGRASPMEKVLRQLWLCVIKPIVEALALSRSTNDTPSTRVWWCPTGPLTFLPLHAAGIYRGDDAVELSEYAVSSYIPTVGVLAERLRNPRDVSADKSGVLLVDVPAAPGCTRIPGTTIEVDRISEKLEGSSKTSVRTLRLQGEAATIKAGIEGMKDYSCVHFACHAVQDVSQPLKSAFRFHDGRLELSTIIQSDLKTADLAFLSACQTSTGTERLSEEAAHLAAGMLAAGYRGVVATMWSIQDVYAPQVADDFYSELLTRSRREEDLVGIDGGQAAYALHRAVRQLREKMPKESEDSFLTWVPYVHFGL